MPVIHPRMAWAASGLILAAAITGCALPAASSNGPASVVPAAPVRSFFKRPIGPGPSLPAESATARKACRAVNGSFARDYDWSLHGRPDYSLYECDQVPYLANDGSIYVIDLRYNSRLRLVPQSMGADVSETQCAAGTYVPGGSSPGPGIWNSQLGLCMPTPGQIRNDW